MYQLVSEAKISHEMVERYFDRNNEKNLNCSWDILDHIGRYSQDSFVFC